VLHTHFIRQSGHAANLSMVLADVLALADVLPQLQTSITALQLNATALNAAATSSEVRVRVLEHDVLEWNIMEHSDELVLNNLRKDATCEADLHASGDDGTACGAVTALDDATACAAASNCAYTAAAGGGMGGRGSFVPFTLHKLPLATFPVEEPLPDWPESRFTETRRYDAAAANVRWYQEQCTSRGLLPIGCGSFHHDDIPHNLNSPLENTNDSAVDTAWLETLAMPTTRPWGSWGCEVEGEWGMDLGLAVPIAFKTGWTNIIMQDIEPAYGLTAAIETDQHIGARHTSTYSLFGTTRTDHVSRDSLGRPQWVELVGSNSMPETNVVGVNNPERRPWHPVCASIN